METVELRPLSLGELLDRTFTLYRRHFWLFVGIMAIPSSFVIPFNVWMFAKGRSMAVPAAVQGPAQLAQFESGLLGEIVLASLVFLFVFWIAYSLAMGAATYAVARAYLGEATTVRDSYRKVGEKFWKLLGVTVNVMLRLIGIMVVVFSILVGVIALGGLIMAGIGLAPGARLAVTIAIGLFFLACYLGAAALCVYLTLRYAVSIPALMMENRGILDSIRRSIALTQGRRGQIFVAFLLAAVLGYVGAIVFQGPFFIPIMISMMHNSPPPAWLLFLGSVSAAVGGSITGPISMIVLVLCYYDARIRKEAFDLEFMMSALNKPAEPAGTVSPGLS